MTLGGDIGFHIYCQSTEGKIDLVPLSRVESHRSMEEGWISCNHPGKCNLLNLTLLEYQNDSISLQMSLSLTILSAT